MKKQFAVLFCFFILNLITLSCSKKHDDKPAIVIDENNLTACPAASNCQYLYSEQADVAPQTAQLKSGAYRVFWGSVRTAESSATLYVRAPMDGNSFTLNKEDILNGRIEFIRSCPACLQIAVRPIDGYVKGLNLSPEKPADQTRWILEGKVIFQGVSETSFRDTVSVKQYFYPNFVYN